MEICRNAEKRKGVPQMLTKQDIWEEILNDVCDCYEDEVGNRICDWGAMCDRCHAPWVQEIYKKRLKEEGLAD